MDLGVDVIMTRCHMISDHVTQAGSNDPSDDHSPINPVRGLINYPTI